MIYVKGFIKDLERFVIGRSLTYPEGWVKIEDIENILQKYKIEKGE